MKIDESLNKIFEIENVEKYDIVDANKNIVSLSDENSSSDQKIENDYNSIRNNLYSILNQGQEALLHALEVAKQSEHPRAFEVVGNLMKNLSDINHQIIDLHTKKSTLENKFKNKEETKTVTNNAIFVGSTAELSQMITQMKKGE